MLQFSFDPFNLKNKLAGFRLRIIARIKSVWIDLKVVRNPVIVTEDYFSEFAKYLRQNDSCSLKSYLDYHKHLT